jgi:hypothetical protein
MKRTITLFSAFFLIFLIRCQVTSPVSTPEAPPILSRVSVQDTLRLSDPAGMRISVRVSDPQRIEEVGSVRFFVFAERNSSPVFHDTLRDDGTDGDILPRDGEHTGRITGADIRGKAGRYRIGFLAVLRTGTAGDTLVAEFQAAEGASRSAPVIVRVDAPDSLSKEDLSSVRLSVQTDDPDGSGDVDSVFCDLYPPLRPEPVVRLSLSGMPSDASPPYTDFGFAGDLSKVLAISGSYAFRFQARDKAGFLSLPKVAHVVLTLPNQPPVLSELTVPDSVSRRVTEPILLTVRVTDPQGAADIQRVYFNSFKPGGSPSSGNPFSMTDDGTNGDVTAGDGIYSRGISISVSNSLGDYRFDFYAADMAGAVSEGLTHVIRVTDQIPD